MIDHEEHVNEELADLQMEIESFKKERERIKAIVGKIGGTPTFNTKIFNIVFLIMVVLCLVISLIGEGVFSLAMIELAVAAVSAKLIYLIHNQSRVNHFQLWIMSALEWRLNEIIKMLKNMEGTAKNKENT